MHPPTRTQIQTFAHVQQIMRQSLIAPSAGLERLGSLALQKTGWEKFVTHLIPSKMALTLKRLWTSSGPAFLPWVKTRCKLFPIDANEKFLLIISHLENILALSWSRHSSIFDLSTGSRRYSTVVKVPACQPANLVVVGLSPSIREQVVYFI